MNLAVALLLAARCSSAFAQGTAFTYQGRLLDGANPAHGNYDLQFTLFDAPTNGMVVAGPVTDAMTTVSNGLFTVLVDFGGEVFGEADRWLGIGARTYGAAAPFTLLTPRQLITPTPVALAARFASNAATVTSVPVGALPATVPQQDTSSQQYFYEGFESTNFPPPGFYVYNIVNWYRVTNIHSEGIACAGSGPMWSGVSCWLNWTNNFPVRSMLSFDWKVSSEADHDFLKLIVDGLLIRAISGEVDWTTVTLPIAAGWHTIQWGYVKNVGGDAGADQGWLDNVRVVPTPGALVTSQTPRFTGEADFLDDVGIGTVTPTQLLHLNVMPGHGEGMEIDSPITGHSPAIYLNHLGPAGRNYRIASYGDNSSVGSFIVRDDTAGIDRLTIDSAGTVNMLTNATVSGNLGVRMASPARPLDVSGVIGVLDGGARTLNDGIMTEVNAQLLNLGLNDGPLNRFGGAYTSADQGGFLRLDGRPWYPLFGFFARSAGSTNEVTQVASITAGGTVTATAFNTSSDRNLKQNLQPMNACSVLEKVVALPLSEWTFTEEPAVRHAGPMAQDFHAAFGLGTDDKHIATVDADGVALAAIQGLNAKVEAENAQLHVENAKLKSRLERLEKIVEASTAGR